MLLNRLLTSIACQTKVAWRRCSVTGAAPPTGIVPGTRIRREFGMEEFDRRASSRPELLKRGALGSGGDRRCGRAAPGRGCRGGGHAPKPGGKLVVGIGQVVRGHQRPHRLRLPLGPADGLRDVRHARQVRQARAAPCRCSRRSWSTPGPEDDDRDDPQGRQVPQRQPDARRGRRLEPQPHPRSGQAGLEQLPRAARRTSGARPSRSTTRRSGSRRRSRPGWSRASASGSSCRRTPTT